MHKFYLIAISLLLISCSSLSQENSKKELEKRLEEIQKQNISTSKLITGWYFVENSSKGITKIDSISNIAYSINPKPILLPTNFKRGEEFANYQGYKGLSIYFDDIGTESWSIATEKATGSELVFILDDKIISINYVNSQITSGVCAFWYDKISKNDLDKIKNFVN